MLAKTKRLEVWLWGKSCWKCSENKLQTIVFVLVTLLSLLLIFCLLVIVTCLLFSVTTCWRFLFCCHHLLTFLFFTHIFLLTFNICGSWNKITVITFMFVRVSVVFKKSVTFGVLLLLNCFLVETWVLFSIQYGFL